MNDRMQLTAYLATLVALVVVFDSALIAGDLNPAVIGALGAFGLGTIIGGLLGALHFPNSSKASAAVGSADSVTVSSPGQGN
jgi:hypothetical protein